MSVILLACGILLAGAGLVAVGFGIPVNELPLGNILIITGAIGLVGGLQLIGLSAALAELVLIRKGQPGGLASPRPAEPSLAARPAIEPEASDRPTPEPRPAVPAPSVDVSASVIERLRSNIPRPERTVPVAEDMPPLSPNGNHPAPAQTEPVAQAPARSGNGTAAVETREPKLDFLFRSRPAKTAPAENFDSMWPKRPARGESQVALRREEPKVAPRREEPVVSAEPAAPVSEASPQETVARREPEPAAVTPPPLPEAEPQPARLIAILKSGVVDGMAYTLYADGSIEAQLPQGTVRFGSIAELRAHIEGSS